MMTESEWSEFRSKAISAYTGIPENGFKSYDEMKSAFSKIPSTGLHTCHTQGHEAPRLKADDPKIKEQEVQLELVNCFKAKFGNPPEGDRTNYFVAFDEVDEPLFFIEKQYSWPLSQWDKIYTNRNPIVGSSRLQLGFQFSSQNQSLTVRPTFALYHEHIRRRSRWFIPSLLGIFWLIMALNDFSLACSAVCSIVPLYFIISFLLKKFEGDQNKMSPFDYRSFNPFRILAWSGGQFDYWLRADVIQSWLSDQLQDFEEVTMEALTSNLNIDQRVERRPPPSADSQN